jgi:hypothetical protein
MPYRLHCEMLVHAGEESERDCGKEAVAEVEGGPACAECRDACADDKLEIMPLGTKILYGAGRQAFDHYSQFSHVTNMHAMLKAIAAMIALNEEIRTP